jgi:demethylmenaquinone methyltransferase/2-methoxy-6-polyprenyl-1,4-benzoquinol methylase
MPTTPATDRNDKSFYDRISSAYDALTNSNEHAAREKGLSLLALQPGERVLEIGYGTGHSLVALAQAVGSGGHVDGIDVSDGMCQVARSRVTEAGLADRVSLKVGSVPPLPYPDAEFDAVSMSFTLELFPLNVIPDVLSEIKRVLKPGGRIGDVSMALVRAGERDSLLEKTYKWMHRHFPHIVDCQPIDVADDLKRAGFTVRDNVELKIWTMPVATVVGVKAA